MYVRSHEDMTMFHVSSNLCANCNARKDGFCANLGDAAIDCIAGISRIRRFRKGQVIVLDEDAQMNALILRTGMAKISHALTDGRHQSVDFLTSGDALFHYLVDPAISVTVEAKTDIDACEVSLADLNSGCGGSQEFGQSLLGVVIGKIKQKNDQVMMLGRKRAEERVASLLVDFSERAARRGEPAEFLRLTMTRAEIADYLSLTTETVSRAFSLLKKMRIVRLPKPNDVVICNVAGLLEIARGGANLSVR